MNERISDNSMNSVLVGFKKIKQNPNLSFDKIPSSVKILRRQIDNSFSRLLSATSSKLEPFGEIFHHFHLKDVLDWIFELKPLVNSLQWEFVSNGFISEMWTGILWKKTLERIRTRDNLPSAVSLNLILYSDKAVVFEVRGRCVHPIWLALANLPEKQRFLRKNMFLYGFVPVKSWIILEGKKMPISLLRPCLNVFVQELSPLELSQPRILFGSEQSVAVTWFATFGDQPELNEICGIFQFSCRMCVTLPDGQVCERNHLEAQQNYEMLVELYNRPRSRGKANQKAKELSQHISKQSFWDLKNTINMYQSATMDPGHSHSQGLFREFLYASILSLSPENRLVLDERFRTMSNYFGLRHFTSNQSISAFAAKDLKLSAQDYNTLLCIILPAG